MQFFLTGLARIQQTTMLVSNTLGDLLRADLLLVAE